MQRRNNTWLYSPSDLIKFLENEAVTWFDRYDKERPGELVADEDSADDQLIQTTGEKHEGEVLQQLAAEGRDVADLKGAPDAFEATLRAMNEGREIIYQARVEYGDFAGYADFLMRVEGLSELGSWHYEVWDTKLARSLKPYFAIQLCCYAEMLEALQGRRPEYVGIVLGNGSRERLKTEDYCFYYRAVKRAFLSQQQMFDPDQRPALSGMSDYGRWNGHVSRVLAARDDLSGVANIRTSQLKKVCAAGISTIAGLAGSECDAISGMEAAIFSRLRSQARLQIASRGQATPEYELVQADPERPRLGLGSLPPASPQDVCFDIEGYPLVDGGLEYLLGVVLQEDGRVAFRDWWAHDRTEERWAFEAFVHWVHGRWCQDPTMHIYHYAPYETTALKRLMGRYACCEQEIDDLLRNHVFVDLYTVLRQALIVGEPAYSLKNIEHLYMAKRDEEIATAGDSMVYYHRWLQERDGPDWTTSPTLRFIRAYNEADCRSTWKMMEWLRVIQSTAAIPFVPAGEVKQPNPTTNERAALAEAMLAEIPRDSADPEKWRVHALLSHLLEFHRREDKPSWWFLFDRAGMTEEELVGDPDCLGALERTARPPEIVKKSYRYEYRFDPAQESKLRDGKSCRFSHDIDLKIEIERIDYNAGLLYFTLGKSRPAPPSRLSLIPDDLVPGKTIVDSIERTVRHYRTTGQLPNAIQDFLYRVRPRIYGHVGGPLILDEADLLSSAKDIVGRMNETTLCIQGPPGCGKTYTGGELIASLLRTGKRVGVASNSHRAICLLLKSAAEAADRMGVRFTGAKAGADDDQEPIHQSIDLLEENGDVFNLAVMPDLVGGTAWVFSRAEAIGQFDYLFVDEAGQVSVANLVGMAPATKNIVLIGDQMQLNQPVQGTHPAESGQSVLEYLLGDQSTISEDRGIFLPRTWRMRSEVCRFISDGIYSGRVSPNPVNDTRRIQLRRGQRGRIHSDSGLVYISLDHDGNTYECSEEAAVIDQLVRELCSYTLELPNEAPKRLNLRDILIVAPFNLQVRKIQSTIPGARVGTVDKFQGQQAPVVVFSMTASEGDASSRGIDFLFSRNRLNVAISRAQILAVIVASSKLVRTRCSRLEQIRLVNLFCGATEAGQAVAVAR